MEEKKQLPDISPPPGEASTPSFDRSITKNSHNAIVGHGASVDSISGLSGGGTAKQKGEDKSNVHLSKEHGESSACVPISSSSSSSVLCFTGKNALRSSIAPTVNSFNSRPSAKASSTWLSSQLETLWQADVPDQHSTPISGVSGASDAEDGDWSYLPSENQEPLAGSNIFTAPLATARTRRGHNNAPAPEGIVPPPVERPESPSHFPTVPPYYGDIAGWETASAAGRSCSHNNDSSFSKGRPGFEKLLANLPSWSFLKKQTTPLAVGDSHLDSCLDFHQADNANPAGKTLLQSNLSFSRSGTTVEDPPGKPDHSPRPDYSASFDASLSNPEFLMHHGDRRRQRRLSKDSTDEVDFRRGFDRRRSRTGEVTPATIAKELAEQLKKGVAFTANVAGGALRIAELKGVPQAPKVPREALDLSSAAVRVLENEFGSRHRKGELSESVSRRQRRRETQRLRRQRVAGRSGITTSKASPLSSSTVKQNFQDGLSRYTDSAKQAIAAGFKGSARRRADRSLSAASSLSKSSSFEQREALLDHSWKPYGKESVEGKPRSWDALGTGQPTKHLSAVGEDEHDVADSLFLPYEEAPKEISALEKKERSASERDPSLCKGQEVHKLYAMLPSTLRRLIQNRRQRQSLHCCRYKSLRSSSTWWRQHTWQQQQRHHDGSIGNQQHTIVSVAPNGDIDWPDSNSSNSSGDSLHVDDIEDQRRQSRKLSAESRPESKDGGLIPLQKDRHMNQQIYTPVMASTPSYSKLQRLSLMTFNTGLLEYRLGGVAWYRNPPFTRRRLYQIAPALKSSKCDIIALQEVYDDWQAEFLIESLRNTYPFVARRTSGGALALHNGLMLFSRFAILHTKFHPFTSVTAIEKFFGSKGMLEATISVPSVGDVMLLNIHLASGAVDPEGVALESLRNEEIRQVFQVCADAVKRNEIPVIIGDLNASPDCCGTNYKAFKDAGWRDAFVSGTSWSKAARVAALEGRLPIDYVNERGRFGKAAIKAEGGHAEVANSSRAKETLAKLIAAGTSSCEGLRGTEALRGYLRVKRMWETQSRRLPRFPPRDAALNSKRDVLCVDTRNDSRGNNLLNQKEASHSQDLELQRFSAKLGRISARAMSRQTPSLLANTLAKEGPCLRKPSADTLRSSSTAAEEVSSDSDASRRHSNNERPSLTGSGVQRLALPESFSSNQAPQKNGTGLCKEKSEPDSEDAILNAATAATSASVTESPAMESSSDTLRTVSKKVVETTSFTKGHQAPTMKPRSLRNPRVRRKSIRAPRTGRIRLMNMNLEGKPVLEKLNIDLAKDPFCSSVFTWDPKNPLNAVGPHAACRGLRCDHVFLPPRMIAGPLGDFRAVKSFVAFTEPRVTVGGCCCGLLGQGQLVTLSDHYAVFVQLARIR